MPVDQSRDPLVFLRTHEEADTPIETQLEELQNRDQPFVLITDRTDDDHRNETQEERKRKALFFKQVRDRLRRLCRGMSVIEGDRPTPLPARFAAQGASKAIGFSVSLAATEEQAVEKGLKLMSKDAA